MPLSNMFHSTFMWSVVLLNFRFFANQSFKHVTILTIHFYLVQEEKPICVLTSTSKAFFFSNKLVLNQQKVDNAEFNLLAGTSVLHQDQ
jgi:hypothetical protein